MKTTMLGRHRCAVRVGCVLVGLLGSLAGAGGAAGAATSPSTTLAKPGGGQPRSAGDAAFCAQITTSQAVIAKAPLDAKAKFAITAKEWANIEKVAPSGLKASVTQVREAYDAAAASGDVASVKTTGVTNAGTRITDYLSASCRGGGAGGFNDPARVKALAAARACLEKNGIKLPTPGQPPQTGQAGQPPQTGQTGQRGQGGRGGVLRGLDPNDPKVAAALKACGSVIPTGGFGGRGGPGGVDFAKIQACLQKKGVTLPGPGAGQGNANGNGNGNGNGGQGGGRPVFDAKTQKAFDECRQAAGNA